MEERKISAAQRGLGDMDVAEFREWAHRVADQVADYLEGLESQRVLPDLEPGDIRARLSAVPPANPEPMESILEDYARIIEPNITHWQHPGFMAYFPSVASGPGILGEWLAAGLNSNVMFWRNAPASTEVEEIVVAWLRQMLGLPDTFDGMLTDTASISSLLSLVVARNAVREVDARTRGLSGPTRLRAYASTEAHFSIDRAAQVAGIGLDGLRRVKADAAYAMDVPALERAIAEDRAAGWRPFCVVATLGTTSSTAIDPAAALADLCEREGLWLHIDAAYGGAAAIAPEYRPLFNGWERADSIVFNPHKWMFTPFDASLLLFRDPAAYRAAFSVLAEYVKTPEKKGGAHDFNEYGIQMGRRFRALKLWILIRWFGVEGIAARVREHCRLAHTLAGWIEADPAWELLAAVPFATVCFRHLPASARELSAAECQTEIDRVNEAILARVNRDGRIFLSHTRLGGRFTLRAAIGNPRVDERHVRVCWALLREAAEHARSGPV